MKLQLYGFNVRMLNMQIAMDHRFLVQCAIQSNELEQITHILDGLKLTVEYHVQRRHSLPSIIVYIH